MKGFKTYILKIDGFNEPLDPVLTTSLLMKGFIYQNIRILISKQLIFNFFRSNYYQNQETEESQFEMIGKVNNFWSMHIKAKGFSSDSRVFCSTRPR